MPVRLHHIVVDARNLPGLAQFWMRALGWKVLSEREREIVIGTDESAPIGMCFMPATEVGRCGVTTVRDLRLSSVCPDMRRLLGQGGLTAHGSVRLSASSSSSAENANG